MVCAAARNGMAVLQWLAELGTRGVCCNARQTELGCVAFEAAAGGAIQSLNAIPGRSTRTLHHGCVKASPMS